MLSGAAGPAIQMADRELKYGHVSTAEVSVSAIFVLKIVTHYVATPLVGSWHSRIGGSHQPRPAAVTALSHQDSGGMAAYARRSRCGKEGLGSGGGRRAASALARDQANVDDDDDGGSAAGAATARPAPQKLKLLH